MRNKMAQLLSEGNASDSSSDTDITISTSSTDSTSGTDVDMEPAFGGTHDSSSEIGSHVMLDDEDMESI